MADFVEIKPIPKTTPPAKPSTYPLPSPITKIGVHWEDQQGRRRTFHNLSLGLDTDRFSSTQPTDRKTLFGNWKRIEGLDQVQTTLSNPQVSDKVAAFLKTVNDAGLDQMPGKVGHMGGFGEVQFGRADVRLYSDDGRDYGTVYGGPAGSIPQPVQDIVEAAKLLDTHIRSTPNLPPPASIEDQVMEEVYRKIERETGKPFPRP